MLFNKNILVISILLSCINPFQRHTIIIDADKPFISKYSPDKDLKNGIDIRITFSEPIQKNSLNIQYNTDITNNVITWVNESEITISPIGKWNESIDKVTIQFSDIVGKISEKIELIFDVYGEHIYVNTYYGNDSDIGTYHHPVKTIQKGIIKAKANDMTRIRISEGTTLIDAGTSQILLDISIYGGFNKLNWGENSPLVYRTVINDSGVDLTGFGSTNRRSAIKVISNIEIKGVEINGADLDVINQNANNCSAITAVSEFTVSNSFINVNNSGCGYGVCSINGKVIVNNSEFRMLKGGVYAIDAPIFISNSSFYGVGLFPTDAIRIDVNNNIADTDSYIDRVNIDVSKDDFIGVFIKSKTNLYPMNLEINDSVIYGNDSSLQQGIVFYGNSNSNLTVRNSRIKLELFGSKAIYSNYANNIILINNEIVGTSNLTGVINNISLINNTVFFPDSNQVMSASASYLTLINNIFHYKIVDTPKSCFTEVGMSTIPIVENNVFIHCLSAYAVNSPVVPRIGGSYIYYCSGDYSSTVDCLNATGFITSSAVPVYLFQYTYLLELSSGPCDILQGGKTTSVTTDINGGQRTVPYSIGAHEYDGLCI